MDAPTIEEIVHCPNLPSLPTVAARVLELSRDDEVKILEIGSVVQHDQALTAKILRTVNSSFYGLSRPCPTITRAITYLGINTVTSLVLGFSLVSIARNSAKGFDLKSHWRRAIHASAASRRLAKQTGQWDSEESFIAALMQDIGMLALHMTLGRKYDDIVDRAGGDHLALPAVERKALGFDHAQVGSTLAQRWRLPQSIAECIRHHHDLKAIHHHQLTRIVALGTQAALAIDMEDGEARLATFNQCALGWFDQPPAGTADLLRAVAEDASELSSLLEVDTGAPPNVHALLAQAEELAIHHQLKVQREADQLRRRNTNLSKLALTDGLTGLANRAAFDHELTQAFEAASSDGSELAVIFLDLDHFKSLNDSLGHQAGDIVLVDVAGRLRDVVGSQGSVCRYGGEEFVVLLAGTGRQNASRMAEAIREAIANQPFNLDAQVCGVDSIFVTTSIGVAAYDASVAHKLTAPVLLLKAADAALYAAKTAGRNCVRVFAPRPASDKNAAHAA